MRSLLLTLTLAACGRLGFDAPAQTDARDAATDAVPLPTWVKACAGPSTHASAFDVFPGWALTWRDPTDATVAVSIDGGTLRIDGSPRALDYAGIRSTSVVFRGRRLATEVLAVPDGRSQLFLGVDKDEASSYMRVSYVEGMMTFAVDLGAVTQEQVVPYDPVVHRWWQVREAGGMTMFETSADDVTYVTHLAVPTPAFVDDALLVLGMGSQVDGPGAEVGRFGSIEACPI